MTDREVFHSINQMYLKLGKNYRLKYLNLSVLSDDNHFFCIILLDRNIYFYIEVEYSLAGESIYKLTGDTSNQEISKHLLPIFRDFKLNYILKNEGH